MRSKLFRMILLIVFLILIVPLWLLAAERPTAGEQGSQSEDQKYAGTWVGSYSVDNGGTEKLSYIFSRDEKGQWRSTVKWTNQDGEQTGELKALQIAGGKLKAKLESPDGMVEVTIEGEFQGDRLEGTYSVSPKGSTEVSEKGTWKVKKSSAPKPGQ
jgi:hypothetical protein